VDDGRLRALGNVLDEPIGERPDLPYLVGSGFLVAGDPTFELPLQETLRAAKVPKTGLVGVYCVQLRQGVGDGAGDPMAKLAGGLDPYREFVVYHNASAALHDVEGRPYDRLVLAEEVGFRGEGVRLVQLDKHAGLAAHVVSFGGDGSERRAPEHALPVPYLEQVGEVRGSGGKLADLQLALGQALDVIPEVPLDRLEVESFSLAHSYRLQGASS
jgi:hypothetical protein